jgi:hypothetical protein
MTTANGVNWQQYVHTFTATGSLTRVEFTNGTAIGDNYAGLDLVSMTAVPEPSTWAMLLIGFGAVGYAIRRRPAHRATQAV